MTTRFCAAMVAGVLGASAWTGAQAQETTLTFATWQAEEPGFGEWWQEMIASFEAEHPEVKIDVQPIPHTDYANQLTIRFASNRPPDIVALPSSAPGSFADQGWLEPLDDRIKGTPIETEWSSLQSELDWNGETQGVLLMGYGFMLFYNKAILEEAGVEVPESFEELKAAVREVTDRDNGIFGLAAVTTEHPTVVLDFIRFIRWAGEDIVVDGAYNLTAPGVVEAIEDYREVVGGNAPLGNNSTIARQLFIDGKAGFLIDGPWVWARLSGAPEDVRDDLVMIPAPVEPVLGGASNSIHIPASIPEEHKELAWSFIEHIAEAENQRQYLLLTASMPGRMNVLSEEDKAQNPHLGVIAEAADGAVTTVPGIQTIRANLNEFSAIIERAALQALSTDTPVEEILAEAQAELESAVPLD
jgi:multiple sugar transport system substrate-binding protein